MKKATPVYEESLPEEYNGANQFEDQEYQRAEQHQPVNAPPYQADIRQSGGNLEGSVDNESEVYQKLYKHPTSFKEQQEVSSIIQQKYKSRTNLQVA